MEIPLPNKLNTKTAKPLRLVSEERKSTAKIPKSKK